MNIKNVTVVGLGYVGFSLSVLIAQKYNVIGLDTNQKKINLINKRTSPILDNDINEYLLKKNLLLEATTDSRYAYKNANVIIIAVPTNYAEETGEFNTEIVETTIDNVLEINKKCTIIIKSTVPIGFTEKIKKKVAYNDIFFSPEFLREGNSLHDNLYPSRIIVGGKSSNAFEFGELLKSFSLKKTTPVIYINSTEAEAIKLFSNAYLAMRVSFFNELDTFSEINNLDTLNIINGVSLDDRIGNFYNNPSFGYGGYCLPKDSKQLVSNFKNIPNNIIASIIKANETRKKHITESIINKKPKTVGIYRLLMKSNSDNFKESSIWDIATLLRKQNINVIIFEPNINQDYYENIKCYKDLNQFIMFSDLIIANRINQDLEKVRDKVYTRDIFKYN